MPVAWLQLEESDADPARFWVSVIAAIGRTNPEIGAHLDMLVAGSLGAGQVVVPALVNELALLTERLVVVLDDYHLIDDAEVQAGMERLIDLCPPQLTLVLITRADPPFRLGRMRVRGRVREIRAGDLRFDRPRPPPCWATPPTGWTASGSTTCANAPKGWAAGLVLAGLSLERTDDADRFVDTFRGDDQLVAGYLTDELLAVLDDDERRRMVEAAVLHRLSGPLLDAVTGSDDGARWLDGLAARNQLVIRLDAVGEWYRYHHLFRDMLLLEARRSIPDRLPDLHRRAAAWFETSGYPAAAVDHLLAAGDREQAMYLMRFVGPDLLGSGQLRTLRNILGRLSAEGELDAICSALSGWDHYLTGRYEQAQQLLDRATATLPADVDPMRTMPLRINLALGTGDVATALAGAQEVIAAGEVEARPSELTTATGAAFAWAGLPEEARAALAIALVRTQAEQRVTAHAMALVAAAVVEFHSAGDEAACAAAQRATRLRHVLRTRRVPRHRAGGRHPGGDLSVRHGDGRRRARRRARPPGDHDAGAGVRADRGRRRAAAGRRRSRTRAARRGPPDDREVPRSRHHPCHCWSEWLPGTESPDHAPPRRPAWWSNCPSGSWPCSAICRRPCRSRRSHGSSTCRRTP